MNTNTATTAAADYDAFCGIVLHSWTYERMTDEEQIRCLDALRWAKDHGAIKGCRKTRWEIMQAVFQSFLIGLGYDGFQWREPENSDATLF